MDINKEIKHLEREEAKLARKKQALASQLKTAKAEGAKLDTLLKNSGYKTPKALVIALIEKYKVRIPKRQSGASATARKRTKVTVELRNAIKKELKSGESMNAVSKKHGISYAVVAKIRKGAYDKLR